MGCFTSIGKIILITLNTIFMIVSLALFAVGIVFKYFAHEIVGAIVGTFSLNNEQQEKFGIPQLKEVTQIPFIGDIGLIFIIFGAFLFAISFFACCGACCRWRPLLILFIVLVIIFVIAESVVGGLFLTRDSVLHKSMKETIAEKVESDYDKSGKDLFSYSINTLNYLLECCGINGPGDFISGVAQPPPASCCKKEIIESKDPTVYDKCISPTASYSIFFNLKGCYDKLQDLVQENILYVGIALGLLLFLQVLEILFAALVIVDSRNKR